MIEGETIDRASIDESTWMGKEQRKEGGRERERHRGRKQTEGKAEPSPCWLA